MANILEIKEILRDTPIEDALMLIGVHGIGKSKLVESIAKEQGAECVTLFLGQSADAGDIIGLPTRRDIVREDGTPDVITDFAPPKWWPTNMEGEYFLFLDEFNRMKPEMGQCVMDLVLNRKLNGRPLPPKTRIIAAINPLDDGYYQVEELDPALMDRFNVYEFNPTPDEWIDWAFTAELHPAVISFISQHKSLLDAPSSKEAKAGQILPSRRSWHRVSKILKNSPKLVEKPKNMQNILHGVVGVGATSEFCKYVKNLGTGLNAAVILTKWDDKIEKKVKELSQSQQVHISSEIVFYLDQNAPVWIESKNDKMAKEIVENLKKFLDNSSAETSAMFFGKMKHDYQVGKKVWTRIVANNKSLSEKFVDVIRS